MFDPKTTQLVQDAPPLEGLNIARLPEELTKAFTEIVSYRLSLEENAAEPNADLAASLDKFRRIAATYEAIVASSLEDEDRQSAAFVAAQAHHLLHLYRKATRLPYPEQGPLSADSIMPEVSAMLLFLIANQTSDAAEMAKELEGSSADDGSPEGRVVLALCALARGRLSTVQQLADGANPEQQALEDRAPSSLLYERVFQALVLVARYIVDAVNFAEEMVEAKRALREVRDLSVEILPIPIEVAAEIGMAPVSAFTGPHHLACLLVTAIDHLGNSALSGTPPPPGLPGDYWVDSLRSIILDRPYLWRNHQQAIDEGLLVPGHSAAISFPTGAGKTTLSLLKVAATVCFGGAVIYLAPTNALVAQTISDLRKAFPDIPVRESLIVDDFYTEIDEDLTPDNAQIVVLTPERCLSLLTLDLVDFSVVRLVVFDECHLIHPSDSNRLWRNMDAMLTLLELHKAATVADWLLISAMMSNADDLAGWVSSITQRHCLALNLDWKPTRQVRGCLVYNSQALAGLRGYLDQEVQNALRDTGALREPGVGVKRNLTLSPFGFFGLKQAWNTLDREDYLLSRLTNEQVTLGASRSRDGRAWYLTPNKNKVAANLAATCVSMGLRVLLFSQSTVHAGSIAKSIDQALQIHGRHDELNEAEEALLLVAAEEMGDVSLVIYPSAKAGCHHGNLIPQERQLSEMLFQREGGISALSATATLAQGMNLPADVVFIVGDERFDPETEGFSSLSASELLNAAGRAGRAGMVADGVVIVLPNSLVGFNPESNTIGTRWIELQQAVFSQSDQCLEIRDPIEHLLDRFQEHSTETDPQLSYFLRRLPRSIELDPAATEDFLNSSLAAWYARKEGRLTGFMATVGLLSGHVQDEYPEDEADWRTELANRLGIDTYFIEQVDAALTDLSPDIATDTEALVNWFFSWVSEDQARLDVILSHRVPEEMRTQFRRVDLFGGMLAQVVWAWMSGASVANLDGLLGGNRDNPGECRKGRKFVLKLVPELAFVAGLLTRIKRMQLGDETEDMPLALATLGICVREGLPSPEAVALKLNDQRPASRISIVREWERIARHTARPSENESFGNTRQRIRNLVQMVNAFEL